MVQAFKIFLVVLWSALAIAKGGDVVGNGGGIAELQLTKLWASLGAELKQCLSSQNLCRLTEDQRALVQQIVESRAQKSAGKIDFYFDPLKSRPVFEVHWDEADFNADRLYSAPGVPVSLSVLMQSAVAAQLTVVDHKIAQDQALAVGAAVGEFWQSTNKVFEGQIWSQIVRFAIVQSRPESNFNYEIYYQDGDTSSDLTELFKSAFPCVLKRDGLNVISARFMEVNLHATFTGRLVYECEDGSRSMSKYQMNDLGKGQFSVDLFD